MPSPFDQFSEADLRAAALKLEQAAKKVNAAFLKVGNVDADRLLPRLAQIYARVLKFDAFTEKKFAESLEEKRVQSMSQGSVIMACVMAAAVALTVFKSSPKKISTETLIERGYLKLQSVSSHPMSLAGLSLIGFYGLMGRGVFSRLKSAVQLRLK